MNEHIVITLALTLLAGFCCQWLAWRVKLPAILFLLFSGLLAGPALGLLNPDELFGDLLFPFISLSVAIVLFEGSLTLNFSEIQGLEKVIRNMITYGALVTWGITTVATVLILDFGWGIAALFGALMVVTGPTVIVPMLRTVRPKESVANILRWEGILIDPIGATIAILVYEFMLAGGASKGLTTGLLVFAKILVIGCVLGAAGGYVVGFLLRRHWIPHYLQNYAVLAIVCGVFAFSNHLEAESGLLTVTVMGVILANMPRLDLHEIVNFKENLSVLLISMLFILLASRIDIEDFRQLGWWALAVFAVIQFLARPLNVQVSALGSKLSLNERHLLSWVAPRGIVAAAISALFAIKLEASGYAEAAQMVPLTFMVIIGTVLLQSSTAGTIARWLKVAEPEPKGCLLVGAHPVSRALAKALEKNGFRALVTDQNWEHIKAARAEGLNSYWGNPVSEHADRHLNLIGIGRMLALSSNDELNALAVKHYRLELGAGNVFQIQVHRGEGNGKSEKKNIAGHLRLFGPETTLEALGTMLLQGAEVRTTRLTDQFGFDQYLNHESMRRVPLVAIDPKGKLHVFSPEMIKKPGENWKIIGLTQELSQEQSVNNVG